MYEAVGKQLIKKLCGKILSAIPCIQKQLENYKFPPLSIFF